MAGESTSVWFSAEELEIAGIMLLLSGQAEFKPRFSDWGLRRKRSVNVETTSRCRLKSPPPRKAEKPTAKVGASSPDTPLSFSPSDVSDTKPKQSKKINLSLKRKRDELLQTVEELSKRKRLLQQEVENVKSYYDKQKSLNLELKQKLIIARSNNMENSPRVEINKQHYLHHYHHQQPLIVETSENQRRQTVGPPRIPDLNFCPEDSSLLDSSQPSDLDNNNKSLIAAQARQKRLQICRFKNSSNNKSRHNLNYRS